MEIQERSRIRTLQDPDNVCNAKKNGVIPTKQQGPSGRGALGELSSNVQSQSKLKTSKVAVSAEGMKSKSNEVGSNRGFVRRDFSHVRSKVDSGLTRVKSMSDFAVGAAAPTGIKAQNNPNELKKSKNLKFQAMKATQITKKVTMPFASQETKEKGTSKLNFKGSTESLGKLKLGDNFKNENNEKIEINTPKLPDDIEDIDAGDSSPLYVSIYSKDIYKYLSELEEKYPIKPNHLKNQNAVTGKMRSILLDWLIDVQLEFSLLSETFQLAVGIIDRYLQIVPNIPKIKLQLIGVSAIFIASKFEEVYVPSIDQFIYVTDNAYDKHDIKKCEMEIVSKLEYCMLRPVPSSFLRRYMKAAKCTSTCCNVAKYFVDLSLIEYSMSHYRPSELAAAAICLSLHLLSNMKLSDVWTPTLSYYSGYTLKRIDPIIRKIAKIVTNVENSKFQAVYSKFSLITVENVPTLPQLKSKAIHDLAKMSPKL